MTARFTTPPMRLETYPSEYLVAKNQRLESYGADEKARVEQMFKLMAKLDGVGLAAPQVGWNVRLFILGVPDKAGELIHRVIWNPEVAGFGGRELMLEGCLSFPGVRGSIMRWTHARVKGSTPEGPLDEVLSGLSAQAAQHEIDHLDALLFIERMSPADHQRNEAAIRALAAPTLKKIKRFA